MNDELLTRVERLERRCRRQGAAIGALLACAAGATLLGAGQGVPDEIRAGRFVAMDDEAAAVLDTKGFGVARGSDGARAHIGFDAIGSPSVILECKGFTFDGNAGTSGSGLTLDGPPTAPRIQLVATPGIATLSATGTDGDPRVLLSVTDKNEPALRLFDAGWEQRAILSAGHDSAALGLSPIGEKPSLMLLSEATGSRIALAGKPNTASVVIEGGVDSNGVKLWDKDQKLVGSFATVEGATGLHLGAGAVTISAVAADQVGARIWLNDATGYETSIKPGSTEDEAVNVGKARKP